MEKLSINDLETILWEEWDSRTSSSDDWMHDTPEMGQCVPASLVIQDFLGGDIGRVHVTGPDVDETHYFNIIDGTIIDVTKSQYDGMQVQMTPAPVDLEAEGYMSMRDRLVSNADTNARYELLRMRVIERLGDRALNNYE